ncbi:MAG TPA: Zn-ribbon domain-containing OB-fold protein [Nitrososphaerales archaeon]|nr:Zn-ribbon domain-containing OB-fold protein [Nitrososphaerales archaeon]
MSKEHGFLDPEAHYPWDSPEYNKISRFFDSLKQSKIETTQCNSCSKTQWPPRSICSNCLSMDLKWVELPTKGTIAAFSKAYIGTIEGEVPPILVAALDLEGGLRLLTRLVNCDFDALKIGMRVKLARTALVGGKPYWAFEPDGKS